MGTKIISTTRKHETKARYESCLDTLPPEKIRHADPVGVAEVVRVRNVGVVDDETPVMGTEAGRKILGIRVRSDPDAAGDVLAIIPLAADVTPGIPAAHALEVEG